MCARTRLLCADENCDDGGPWWVSSTTGVGFLQSIRDYNLQKTMKQNKLMKKTGISGIDYLVSGIWPKKEIFLGCVRALRLSDAVILATIHYADTDRLRDGLSKSHSKLRCKLWCHNGMVRLLRQKAGHGCCPIFTLISSVTNLMIDFFWELHSHAVCKMDLCRLFRDCIEMNREIKPHNGRWPALTRFTFLEWSTRKRIEFLSFSLVMTNDFQNCFI